MGFLEGIFSLIGGIKARDAAREEGGEQAAMEERITAEKMYLIGKEERFREGEVKAAAAGSGVSTTVGSPLQILAEQAQAFTRQKQVTSEVGAMRARLVRTRARNIGDAAIFKGATGFISGFAKGASSFGGGGGASGGASGGGGGGGGMGGWSDPALKTNIKKVGEYKGINIYTWDWNGLLGLSGSSMGVMADEIPQEFVSIHRGYMRVNYRALF